MATVCQRWQRIGNCLADPLAEWYLAPGDAKPFKVDASIWLDSGDSLTNAIVITAPDPLKSGDGIDHPSPIHTTSIITFWLYNAQQGHEYAVNIQFTTANNITHTVSALVRGGY